MKKRTKSYSREFKLEAVRLSHQSDQTVSEVASELGISKRSLFRWRDELAVDPEQAFPGRGQMKDRDAELARLRARKELRFQFIHDHRHRYRVELMCQVLQVSRSGYYAWRKRKPSARKMANENFCIKSTKPYAWLFSQHNFMISRLMMRRTLPSKLCFEKTLT